MPNTEPETPVNEAAADAAFAAVSPPVMPADNNEVARLKREVIEANERVLRSQAEIENFRKRMRREMDDERRYAALPLIRDLLGVVDNLHRAIQAAEQSGNASGLLEGVKLVVSQFDKVLDQYNCRRIDTPIGIAFDPTVHEALAQIPSPDQPAGAVTTVTRHGYQLHDRVIRPTQVRFSAGPPASSNP